MDFFIYLFFLTSLLEYNCFTMLCQFLLYNKVNQLYAQLPPTLPIPPLQVVTKHRADLPVLCGCFPLASYFTFGSVYMLWTFLSILIYPYLDDSWPGLILKQFRILAQLDRIQFYRFTSDFINSEHFLEQSCKPKQNPSMENAFV